MAVGLVPPMVLVLVVAPLVLLIWALSDLLKRPTDSWTSSGMNQMVWVVVVVFVGLIGPILYLSIARPRLDDAARGLHPMGFSGHRA